MALHKSQQWRKLLSKWSSYFDELLGGCTEDVQRTLLLTIFKEANQRGSNTTNDPVYNSAIIPILQKLVDLHGKQRHFKEQGINLCELGQSFSFIDNDIQEMACYVRACEIGDKHGIASVKCRGNLGVGRMLVSNKQFLEAKPVLRLALDAAQSGETGWMRDHAVICADDLCNVLFRIDAIDEAEKLVQLFPRLLKKSLKLNSSPLQHYHMRGFILLARFFEAKNRPEDAASEIYKMLSLIEANKDAIHDFRPLFLFLLDEAEKNLRILNDTDIGNLQLAKAVYSLRDEQRRKTWYW